MEYPGSGLCGDGSKGIKADCGLLVGWQGIGNWVNYGVQPDLLMISRSLMSKSEMSLVTQTNEGI